jgi:ABC-type multidrug transport system ATPase subunit
LLEEVEGADRIVLLIKGEVKADGTPAELMQMAQATDLTEAYITLTAAKPL